MQKLAKVSKIQSRVYGTKLMAIFKDCFVPSPFWKDLLFTWKGESHAHTHTHSMVWTRPKPRAGTPSTRPRVAVAPTLWPSSTALPGWKLECKQSSQDASTPLRNVSTTQSDLTHMPLHQPLLCPFQPKSHSLLQYFFYTQFHPFLVLPQIWKHLFFTSSFLLLGMIRNLNTKWHSSPHFQHITHSIIAVPSNCVSMQFEP